MGKYQPALLGGLFIGVLSAIPFVNVANCCCLWVLGGGVLVTYLIQQSKPVPVETAEAVLQGLLAGVIGAVILCVASVALSGLTAGMTEESIRQSLDRNNQITPEMRENILRFVNGRNLGLLMAVVTIPLFGVFGMLGSLLGLAIFRKKVPPQAPPIG